MKKFFLLLLLGVFSLSLPGEGLVPLNDWKVLYAGESSFENGVLKGTPQNSGSSIVKKISSS